VSLNSLVLLEGLVMVENLFLGFLEHKLEAEHGEEGTTPTKGKEDP